MSFESDTQARFENALYFVSHNRGELALSVELDRSLPTHETDSHVWVTVEAGQLRDYPYFEPPSQSRNRPFLLYPVRKARVGAILSSSRSAATPVVRMTHCRADDPTGARMEVTNALLVYDDVLVDWLNFSQPGVHQITVAGNLAVASFIEDMRAEGEIDRQFSTIADYCITACNYAQRKV